MKIEPNNQDITEEEFVKEHQALMNSELLVHPLAERFPLLSPKDYQELKDSIAKYGLFEMMVLSMDGRVLEGRTRLAILKELGWTNYNIRLQTIKISNVLNKEKITPDDEARFVFDSNMKRRHLTDDQRSILHAQWAPLLKEEAQAKQEATKIKPGEVKNPKGVKKKARPDSDEPSRNFKKENANSTVGKLARSAKVSRHKMGQALTVNRDAPELVPKVQSGELTLVDAVKEAKTAKQTPKSAIATWGPEVSVKPGSYEKIDKAWQKFINHFPEVEQGEVKRVVYDILNSELEDLQ